MSSPLDEIDRIAEPIVPAGLNPYAARALILQVVGGRAVSQPFGADKRGQIHVSLTADPAFNTSELVTRLVDIVDGGAVHVNAANSSRASAVGSHAGASFSPGPVLDEDSEYVVIENVDEFSNTAALEEILSVGRFTWSEDGAERRISTDAAFLFVQRPSYGKLDQYEPVGEQMNISPQIWSAVDVAAISLPDDSSLSSSDLSLSEAGAELRRARSREAATVDDAAESALTDAAQSLLEKTEGEDPPMPVPSEGTLTDSLRRLATASATLRGAADVAEEDVDAAASIIRDSLEAVGMIHEPAEFGESVVTGATTEESSGDVSLVMFDDDGSMQKKAKEKLEQRIEKVATRYKDEPGAPVDKILEVDGAYGWDPQTVEKALEKLRTRGEIYEPQQGYVRTT